MKKLIALALILFFVGCTTIPLSQRARAIEFFSHCPALGDLFAHEEVIAFICNTGETVTFSSYEKQSVVIEGGREYIKTIIEALGKLGKTLADVDLAIHNHFINKDFSNSDKSFYFELRRNGFRGAFAIYYVPTREIIGINDNG